MNCNNNRYPAAAGSASTCFYVNNIACIPLQALFFGYVEFTPHQGLYWMGIMVLLLSSTVFLIYFPMWGGMWCRPKPGSTEEGYYLAEFTQEERARGAHFSTLAFAHEARSNRGPDIPTTGGGASGGVMGGGGARASFHHFVTSLKLPLTRQR